MAKQIERFEIIIRGTKATGPTEAIVSYRVQDSVNTELLTRFKHKEISSPDFTKKIKDADTAGEFWYDEVAAAETDEGIS